MYGVLMNTVSDTMHKKVYVIQFQDGTFFHENQSVAPYYAPIKAGRIDKARKWQFRKLAENAFCKFYDSFEFNNKNMHETYGTVSIKEVIVETKYTIA